VGRPNTWTTLLYIRDVVSSEHKVKNVFNCLCVEKRLTDLLLGQSRVVGDRRSQRGTFFCLFIIIYY